MAPLIELYRTDHESLVGWICRTYGIAGTGDTQFLNPHRLRRETTARRLRLYRNQHTVDVAAVIDQVYDNADYKTLIKKMIPVALEQNVTQRIVDEVASLYDLPVVRILKDERQRARFAAEEERLALHGNMRLGSKLTMLCGEVLLWQFEGAEKKNKLRIVTPDLFDAIPHPADTLVEAGLVIDQHPVTVLQGADLARLPHFEVWDDTYRYLINAMGNLVNADGTPARAPIAHGFGRIPGVLFHHQEPTTCILDASHGSDIESAHLGVALLEVMIMRLSKAQGENQPVLQGNIAAMAKGQTLSGEKPLLLPPEVVAFMLEMKTDPDHYLSVKKDKLASVGATYGISYEEMTRQTVPTSGKEWQARRAKLTELRNQRRLTAVPQERATVKLIGFDSVGMRIDYQEQAVPQDASEKIALLRDKVKLGLDSPIAYLVREDPDLTKEDAVTLLKRNLAEYGALIAWVRALNVPMDGDADNPGQDPKVNGGNNTPKNDNEPDYDALAQEVLRGAQ